MKILWICNKKLSIISKMQKQKENSFGGWLDSTADSLVKMNSVSFCALFPEANEYSGEKDNFSFHSFIEENCIGRFETVMKSFNPDVIHIWGTEFGHTHAAMKVAEALNIADKCIISVQGLVSLYGKHHYTEGLPDRVVRHYTLRDAIRHDNIAKAREAFIKRGTAEIEAIKMAKHVIGRTDWDKAAVQMFNPEAEYHFCNESLRDSFYTANWDIEKVERESIFVSQCNYPIKGFHYLLEAMPEIVKRHPNAHIYTTGIDLLHMSAKEKLKMSSYQQYLIELIKKYNLEKHISFLGNLSETEMCKQYLKANVFVSASTIENSPNSVGEAMLVGCPVVSSDVGGVKNMLEHGREGFIYQSSAPYMLAYYVNKIFEDDSLALCFSKNGKEHAVQTHDRKNNIETLLKIYDEIKFKG